MLLSLRVVLVCTVLKPAYTVPSRGRNSKVHHSSPDLWPLVLELGPSPVEDTEEVADVQWECVGYKNHDAQLLDGNNLVAFNSYL
jgi:hypothetical protein